MRNGTFTRTKRDHVVTVTTQIARLHINSLHYEEHIIVCIYKGEKKIKNLSWISMRVEWSGACLSQFIDAWPLISVDSWPVWTTPAGPCRQIYLLLAQKVPPTHPAPHPLIKYNACTQSHPQTLNTQPGVQFTLIYEECPVCLELIIVLFSQFSPSISFQR